MFIVFGIMISGIVAGYFLRRIPDIKIISKFINIFIFLLLFFLGIAVGNNQVIMKNLHTIGLQAVIITSGALVGSILLAWIVYLKFFKKVDSNVVNDENQK